MSVALDDLLDLGRLALALGLVNRFTCHEDGLTPESDTTHTVMLALIAPVLAERLRPGSLKLDRIVALAVVHDLAEALVGDTNTLGATEEQLAEKRERERQALSVIRTRLGAAGSTFLIEALDEYEAQETAEARWVCVADKVMPKITHRLNGRAVLLRSGLEDGAREARKSQVSRLHQRYPDLADLIGVIDG